MDKGLDFSAVKYHGGGEEDVLRLDQLRSDDDQFDGSDLEMFNPIRADEVFEIEIRSGLDPMKVIERLHFDSADLPDVSIAEDYEYPVDWLEDWDFDPIHGAVSRLAVLIQDGKHWRIAGLRFGDEFKMLLVEQEDTDNAANRYKPRRVLGDFWFHTEGPGPVSWDGNSALLEMDGFWIHANGGDISDDDRLIGPGAGGFGLRYLVWLMENSAQIAFIMANVKCAWTDTAQAERYAELFDDVSEVFGLADGLSSTEVEAVLQEIEASESGDKAFVQILSSPSHPLAPALLAVMDEVVQTESGRALMWRDGFVAHLERLSSAL
jgi:hypothetical protein